MQTRIRDRLEKLFRGKSFSSKPPLTDRLNDGRMITLTRQLKSTNPVERRQAEKELGKDRGSAEPYIRKLLEEPNLDLNARISAVRLLGGIEGPAAIRPPYRIAKDSSGPRVEVDPAILQALSKSMRRSNNPKLRKEISRIFDKLKRPI